MIPNYMTVDIFCFNVKHRIYEMNKTLDHFMEIKYVSYNDHLEYLRLLIDNGKDKRILKKLAGDCLPIIDEILKKNVSLFSNIKEFGSKHEARKLNEKINGIERPYSYSWEEVQDRGTLRAFKDETKTAIFNRYRNELQQWEKLFKEIVEIADNKSKFKTSTVEQKNSFTYDQVYDLFHLINDDTNPQFVLFDRRFINPGENMKEEDIEEYSIETLLDFINTGGLLTEESPKKKLCFNCQKWQVALIFDWFKFRNYISDAPTKVGKSGIFFSKRGKTLITQGGLSTAISDKLIKESFSKETYEELLKKNFRAKPKPLTPHSQFPDVITYLCFRLYEIFEKGKI